MFRLILSFFLFSQLFCLALVRADRGEQCLQKALSSLVDKPIRAFKTYQGRVVKVYGLRFPELSALKSITSKIELDESSSILEIGYGDPHLLSAIKDGINIKSATGLDIVHIPQSSQSNFKDIKLIKANIPTDITATMKLKSQGQHDLIYGVDVFKDPEKFKFGEVFDPPKAQVYINWLNMQLKEGGTFMMVNDFNASSNFTKEMFQNAGFEIIEWGTKSKEMERGTAMYENSVKQFGEGIGDIRTYIIRKPKKEIIPKVEKSPSLEENNYIIHDDGTIEGFI